MNAFEFTLRFRLPTTFADVDQVVGALAEAGCDDATVGIGRPGRISLAFEREAGSALDAMASAVRNVERAIPGAELEDASSTPLERQTNGT